MSRQYIHHESTADKLKALVCALFPRKDSTSGGKKKRMRAGEIITGDEGGGETCREGKEKERKEDDEMSKSRMDLLRFLASTNKV
eukprot:821574-Amorphochlora_amoeboformis.AAC.3